MKLWGGRFQEEVNKQVEDFTASIGYDIRLAHYDILGSKAHTQMLVRQEIISPEEGQTILQGLSEIQQQLEDGTFPVSNEKEDIHLHIESALLEKIGPLGGKLHTGRSRNDQVALDMRLYLGQEILEIKELLLHLLATLAQSSERYLTVILPGYTHLQRAQPIRLSHHLLAYYEMFKRDLDRLIEAEERVWVMPLGSGALAGSPLPLDREWVAWELGFQEISKNSMDAVSDRDFILEFLSLAAITGQHISRLAEDIILWSTAEFGFITLSDSFCTGSSIMPQKKNPDVAELLRGKTGRLYGNLVTLLTVMKGLPLAYNRDLQEDKEALFDTIDTLKPALLLTAGMLEKMQVHPQRMREACTQGYLQATDVADYLVQKGLPFRDAHQLVGKMVLWASQEKRELTHLTPEEWSRFSPLFTPDIEKALDLEGGINRRNLPGGVAQEENQRHLQIIQKEIKEYQEEWEKKSRNKRGGCHSR